MDNAAILGRSFVTTPTETKRKRRVLTRLHERATLLFSEMENLPHHKRHVCTNETVFLVNKVYDVIEACNPKQIPTLTTAIEDHVQRLTNTDALRKLLDYCFRTVRKCICSPRANPAKIKDEVKTAIHHIVTAIIEAYPALQGQLIAATDTAQYRHNCLMIDEYFATHPNDEPKLCMDF